MISFQNEGKPFVRKVSSVQIAQRFNTISSFLSANTNVLMSEEEAAEMLDDDNILLWNQLVKSISLHLTKLGLTWYSIDHPAPGPQHLGWSRLVTESHKAKKYYSLFLTNKGSNGRNSNERAWSTAGLTNYDAKRWDNVYRNYSRLRCSKRVKYQGWRIIWAGQELNRYKDRYVKLKHGNSTACSG